MVKWIDANKATYGTDPTRFGAGLMLREDCTQAVCNVLRSGNVLKSDPNYIPFFAAPFELEYSLEHGELQNQVNYVNSYEPYSSDWSILGSLSDLFSGTFYVEGVQVNFADPIVRGLRK